MAKGGGGEGAGGTFFEVTDFFDQCLRITRLQKDPSVRAALCVLPSSLLQIISINKIWKQLPGYHGAG